MHLTRQKVSKIWPIERKGTAYVVRPAHDIEKGIPILVILRDILKIAENRKEVKKAIFRKQILLNEKPVRDERNNALLFDVVTLISQDTKSKMHYRIDLGKNKKLCLIEIKEKESRQKTSKIINKKLLKDKKMQINLSDGRNILSDIKCNVGDSILVNLEDNKLSKHLPLKEKANVIVFAGKHIGQRGTIKKIDEKDKTVRIITEDEEITVLIKQIIVTE